MGTPIEFIKLFDPDESDENNKKEEQLEDIRVDIKKIADGITKVDFAAVTKDLFDKRVEIKTLDEKFRSMEDKFDKKT